ncbi:MAG: DNA-directed RNA polymerase subunit A'' [Candidatus Micrarchaeota archaeon]|nr:DNA-directed RNA polymerase subunit A'' [Candidatus Micrarchaeota archaeon]
MTRNVDKDKKDIMITPGEGVGILTAHSIGEPGTQMTMRTFHLPGVVEAVPTGLPRLIEIVDAKKKPKKPVVMIYLKEKYKDMKKVEEIAEKIDEVLLKDVAKFSEDFRKRQILIRIDKDEIRQLKIDLIGIKKKIKAELGPNIKMKHKGEKVLLITKDMPLRMLRKFTNKMKNLHIKGVKGINKPVVTKDENGEWLIVAGGSNLTDLFKFEDVDPSRSTTNDIMEIYNLFGIEAARNAIVNEMYTTMKIQKVNVDIRHICLLADAMTVEGEVVSVGRHGLSGRKPSVLARAAFEETVKHLVNAAINGEEDRLRGVTENILIGQPVPLGTGLVKLTMKHETK